MAYVPGERERGSESKSKISKLVQRTGKEQKLEVGVGSGRVLLYPSHWMIFQSPAWLTHEAPGLEGEPAEARLSTPRSLPPQRKSKTSNGLTIGPLDKDY